MKRRQKATWFLSGILTATLLSTSVMPAFAAAANKVIDVFTGVNVYVDDVQIDAGDTHGNPEAFVYNGTTYVAVAAVSKSLGKPVQWDGKTSSVYIGSHQSNEPAVWLSDLDYFSGTSDDKFFTMNSEQDNMGDTHHHVITWNFDRTYHLNGQYSKMTGTLYQIYKLRSSAITPGSSYLEIYGDGKLLYNVDFPEKITGFMPESFEIDLTGVLELQVKFGGGSYSIDSYSPNRSLTLSLGDCGLWV